MALLALPYYSWSLHQRGEFPSGQNSPLSFDQATRLTRPAAPPDGLATRMDLPGAGNGASMT
jgi:hypothetical protein